jgi:HAD superfamily hydrolase (TIGR01459 family)
MSVSIISGLENLADQYDGAILDLWGVLHDGERPMPGALDCLKRLRAAGWRLVLLSNAPRRAAPVAEQIAGFGIPEDSYDGLITSGDLTRDALADPDDWHRALGPRFFHLGPERDWGLLDDLPYERVEHCKDSNFILNTGLFDDETETEEDYQEFLAEALARQTPMICANPDRVILRGDRRISCAGAVAAAYEVIGGKVQYHGKPDSGAYVACFSRLAGIPKERIVAVGDSLSTDIAGAVRAGIDSVFVFSGIDGGDLRGMLSDAAIHPARLEELLAGASAVPTRALGSFAW